MVFGVSLYLSFCKIPHFGAVLWLICEIILYASIYGNSIHVKTSVNKNYL